MTDKSEKEGMEVPGSAGYEVCPECQGKGTFEAISNDSFSSAKDIIATCPTCQGTGLKLQPAGVSLSGVEILGDGESLDFTQLDEVLAKQPQPEPNGLLLSPVPDIGNVKRQERERIKLLILQAIMDEPEYPGNLPDELWQELDGNKGNVKQALRSSVRLTKNGITARFLEALREEEKVDVSDNNTG
ncbi:hypothetical protein LCGC14_0365270 [marine sediment metagenome]|uniref:CR-type domain-containing protein n=1 Tax=marine sediment metagenome TaxID=412755 RepID=A0A0F9VTU9_9ZZZZ